ncbi:Ig-like domain-containing protein [Brevibacillus sp. NPDC003359]|uniref:Ig-like domain-containing protein n=1 Tax=unclassified Brevibacillus TaxID=2684853 RepID=UPI0036B2100F
MNPRFIRSISSFNLFLLLALLFLQLVPEHAIASANSKTYLIGFKENKKAKVRAIQRSSVQQLSTKVMVAQLTESEMEVMSQDENVAYIEEDSEIELAETNLTEKQEVPWGIAHIRANQAHEKNFKGQNIKIGIIDTGISNHEDLRVKGGISYVEGKSDFDDEHGHGTAVAGVIAGKDNDVGIVGVAPEAEIYAIRVLDEKGHGTYSSMIQGIEWAIQNDMNIVSISAGGKIDSQALHDQIKRANQQGILVIASAGNRGMGEDTQLYPAKYAETLSIGAIDQDNQRADFSSVGSGLDLMAPGVDILSTSLHGDYEQRSGTSLAAPHVAGAAAVIWSKKGNATNREVRDSLVDHATPLGESRFYGKGLVNLEKALGLGDEDSAEIISLESKPNELRLSEGENYQLKITANMTDGNTRDVSKEVIYKSKDEKIATVTPTGLVTGSGMGDTQLIATLGDKTIEIPIVVTERAPLIPRGGLDTPEKGELISGTYTIKGWHLNPDGVSQINILIDGMKVGEASYGDPRPDIEAKYPAYQNSNAGFHYQLDTGNLTAGTHIITVEVQDTNGQQTIIEGTTFYIGNMEPLNGLHADVTKLELTNEGSHQLVVSTVLEDNTLIDVTSLAEYASSDESIATVDSTGLVKVMGDGTAIVTIRYEGQSIMIPVTINKDEPLIPRWELEAPTSNSMMTGATLIKGWYLEPVGVSKIEVHLDGTVVGEATYGHNRPDIESLYPHYKNATAGFEYLLDTTQITEGQHTIKVTAVNKEGAEQILAERAVFIGRAEPATGIVANISKVDVIQGNTQQLSISAVLLNQQTKDVTREAQYTVENPAIISISDKGIVTGIEIGQTNITVKYQEQTLTIPVWVKAAAGLARGGIDSPADHALISGVYPVTGWFIDSNGVEKIEVLVDGAVSGEATYGISRPEIEIMDASKPDGNVGFHYNLDTGKLREGTHTLSVRGTGKGGNQVMLGNRTIQVVTLLPAIGLRANVTELIVPQGKTHQFAVMAVLEDQSSHDVTKLALYNIENSSVAKVSTDGLVTALAQGSTSLTIKYGDQSIKIPITVTEAEALKTLGEIETPVNGAIVNGTYTISGWFLHPSAISDYRVVIDGIEHGKAKSGIARPDIALLHSEYKNTQAGYSYNVDLNELQPGNHTVSVIATDSEGKQYPLPERNFVIGNIAPAISLQNAEPNMSVAKDAMQKLQITASFEGQQQKDITGEAVYTVEDPNVVYVSPLGIVTGLKVGMTKIHVNYGNQSLVIPVVVTESESGSLVAKGQMDIPKEGTVIGGTTTIQGWILNPSGVSKIEVLVDGQLQGTAVYGGPRPDIFAMYPHYQNANAGFQYLLDTSLFTEGNHKLTIKVTDKAGAESLVLESNIIIGPVTGITANYSEVTLEKDKSVAFTVVASYRDKSTKDVTGEVTYTIDNPAITKIDATGLLTGLSSGSTVLTVSYAGIVKQYPVTVKGDVLVTGGAIDTPQDNELISRNYNMTGWFVSIGEVEKIEVLMDGDKLGEAKYGLERPDMKRKYPDAPHLKPGFSYLLEVDQMQVGEHQLQVLVTEKDGKQTSMEKTITIVEPIHDTYAFWLQFSNQQGQNNWSYQEVSGDRFTDLEWDKAAEEWKSNQNETAIGNTWIKVGSSDPILKWKAPRSGQIHVSGWISKIQVEEGDGVNVRLLKNDAQIWPSSGWQSIDFNDEIGVELQEELSIEEGDALIFQVNQKENSVGDLLKWTPEITYITSEVNDNSAPQVYLTSPMVGKAVTTVNSEDVIVISGIAMDPNIGDQVHIWYQLDEEDPHELTRFTASESANEFSYNLPIRNLKPDHLYSLRVWAVDQKSSKSLVEKVDISLDMRAQAEKDPITIAADWKYPRDRQEIPKGQSITLNWDYYNGKGYPSYIASQELIIYISEGGHVTSTKQEKLTGTARSYVFDTNFIQKNALIDVRLKAVMKSDAPKILEGSTAKLEFYLLATNQAPVVVNTELLIMDSGRTGLINYSLRDNDVSDKIVSTKLRVGLTPGGNELGEKEETISEASQNGNASGRYFFPITKEMLYQTVYWTVQAQDNRGAWTTPTNYSSRLVDALPKIVIYTPGAKRVIDIDETFTLEGVYTHLESGDIISGRMNRLKDPKQFTTTGSSGQWSLSWRGRDLGEGTYPNIEVSNRGGFVAVYPGSLTIEKKPDAPNIIKVEAETNSLKVFWSPVAGATDYGIQVDGGGIKRVGNVSNHTITGLQPDRAYTIILWAYNSSGTSSYSSSPYTVRTKPAESNFNLLVEYNPVRMHFPADQAKYFKITAKTSGVYQFTLNNDSGLAADANISVYKGAGLLDHEEISSGSNGRVNPVFAAGKTYYVKIVGKSAFYATLLAKPGGEAFIFNQPNDITIPGGQTVEIAMNVTIPGKYRMVTQLKNPIQKYPAVTVYSNGIQVSPREKPSAAEVIYDLAAGAYTIKLTNTESNPVNVLFTVFAPAAGGTVYEYVYDQNNRIKAIKENGVESVIFYHDENGNITKSVKQNASTPPKAKALSLDMEKVDVSPGNSKSIKVMATLDNGSQVDVSAQAVYVVEDPSVASINKGIVYAVNGGTTRAKLFFGGQSKAFTITVDAPSVHLTSISLAPGQSTITEGQIQRLYASAYYSDGNSKDISSVASFDTSNSSVAQVSSQGVVTGIKAGTATITVSYDGKNASSQVTVQGATIQEIKGTPAQVTMVAGGTQQLSVTATYSNGAEENISKQAVYSSSNSNVASVDSGGLITALSPGATQVTVSYGGQSTIIPVTVSGNAITLVSLAVTPATVSIGKGANQQLEVKATYSDNSQTIVTNQATYQSSQPAIANVGASGSVTGVAVGSSTITISFGGKVVTVPVQVTETQEPVQRLSVTPVSLNMLVGKTQQLQVKAAYKDGKNTDVSGQAVYLSGDATVVTVDSSGVATAVKAGSTNITVSFGGASVAVPVVTAENVIQSIKVIPEKITMLENGTKQLLVNAVFMDGTEVDITNKASYILEDQTIASATTDGLLTGLRVGSTSITIGHLGKNINTMVHVVSVESKVARLSAGGAHTLMVKEDGSGVWAWGQNENGQLGDGTIQIRTTPVESMLVIAAQQLVVSPSTVLLPTSQSKPLRITATYANNSTQDVTMQSTYESSDPAVASVDAGGVITAVSVGTTTITVSYYDKTITVPVEVKETGVKVNRLSAGGSHTLMVKEDGSVWAWGQNENGQLGDGTIQIRMTPVESMLVISAQQLVASPSTVLLPTSQSKPLRITATYANNSTQDVTTQSTYESSDPAVASVDAGGVITAVSVGTTTITVNHYGKTITVPVVVKETGGKVNRLSAGGAHTLMVKEDGSVWAWGQNENGQLGDGTIQIRTTPVESILVVSAQQLVASPSTVLLSISHSKPLRITATYANNSTQDVTTQSTYESSDPAVASVDAAGLIKAVSIGKANITVRYYNKTITVPVEVREKEVKVNRLSAGGAHTLMVKEDGSVWAWGQNDMGQLGNNSLQNSTVPVVTNDNKTE